jgi:hypothetical protein
MRRELLEQLARRAATDAEFLRQARRDLESTLTRYGYNLTPEELRSVRDVQRRTTGMGDDEVVRALLGGLEKRGNTTPVRPAAPTWRGSRPARPGKPER